MITFKAVKTVCGIVCKNKYGRAKNKQIQAVILEAGNIINIYKTEFYSKK